MGAITVFLADDSAIIRAGVSAMLQRYPDVERRRGGLRQFVAGAIESKPQVVVTDIRMPPQLPERGHRRRQGGAQAPPGHRGRDPLAVRRPRVRRLAARRRRGGLRVPPEGPHRRGQTSLARAIREVATGGSMLDPRSCRRWCRPAHRGRADRRARTSCCEVVAEGRPMKAIAGTPSTRRPRRSTTRSSGSSSSSPRGPARPGRSTAPAAAAARRSSTARSRARR